MELLEIKGLSKSFGGLQALRGLDLSLARQEILLLGGENGAGKSTLFNMISGLDKANEGRILFEGQDLHTINNLEISRLGITRLFQHSRLFANLTVQDNLIVAARHQYGKGLPELLFKPRAVRREAMMITERAAARLAQFGLDKLADMTAGQLSYGQQKLIAFCMLTMNDVKLMLLDEPFAGLSPQMIGQFSAMIRSLQAQGVSFIIVEHNIKQTRPLCDRHLVLEGGQLQTAP